MDVKDTISYQVMSQPAGQDVTVKFADGTSFTARYCGSGSRRYDESGVAYLHVELTMLTPIDANVNALPCNDTMTGLVGWPCILPAGHTEIHHEDRDGDLW